MKVCPACLRSLVECECTQYCVECKTWTNHTARFHREIEGDPAGADSMTPHTHCFHFYQSRYALLIPAGFILEKCCLCSETRTVAVGDLQTETAP